MQCVQPTRINRRVRCAYLLLLALAFRHELRIIFERCRCWPRAVACCKVLRCSINQSPEDVRQLSLCTKYNLRAHVQ
eukprot:6191300-Pleurochrysis_carterae.AAC.1